MKVVQNVGAFTFEVEAESVKELFEKLASLHDVFNPGPCPTAKDGYNMRPQVRTVPDKKNPKKTYDYYEWVCMENGMKLKLGQNQNGVGLFPKRKDADGQYLENNGWSHYKSEE